MRTFKLVLFSLAALLAATPLSAQQTTSLYTSVASKTCVKFNRVIVAGDEYGASYDCRGLPGYRVIINDEDLRTVVTIGFNRSHAREQPAAEQGFAPFNSVHDNLEWRISARTSKPFATIQRWRIADQNDLDKDSRPNTVGLLVVTRIPPGASCHVAYVDVRANENPNVLAQKAADELAPSFDCEKDKVQLIGNRGRAAELSGIQ